MKKITFLIAVISTLYSANAQDTCATAVPVTAGTYVVDVVNGSQVPNPICAPNGTGANSGEWYLYTASADFTVTVSTSLPENTGKDTRVHIYSGTCNSLSCVAGDDDSGNGYLSIVTFNALEGQSFYIAFDNRWNSSGFTFQVTEGEYVEPEPSLISFMPSYQFAGNGTKYCVVDMNGDFLDDIVTVSNGQITILYQQVGGGFVNANLPAESTSFMPSWSLAAGDWDGNGYNDLLYGGGSGITLMTANDDGTAYSKRTSSTYIFSQRTNFVDLNNDGHLDMFVCHDVEPNVFFLNDGQNNMQFFQGGIGDYPSGGNYGSIWFDYDNDGDVDLFLSKCRGGQSNGANINEFYRNNGDGTFTSVGPEINMNDPIQTWSSAVADFDNDGYMDVFVGASSFTNGGHVLKRNNGDGTFVDVFTTGIDNSSGTSIEFVAHDFNNDGFADIFGPNNKIFLNNGDLTFTEVAILAGEGPIGDLNNDGFLDIHNDDQIFYNQPNDNNWVKITFEGVQSNRNGIGARVEIHGDWGTQIRDVMSGTGFRYMSTLNTHFGIGQAASIDQLVVKWPSGVIDVIDNPGINQTIHVIEGASLSVENPTIATEFKVYPNPTQDLINITSDTDKFTTALIYDISGKLALNVSLDQNQQVSIKDLSAGTYILLLKSEKGKYAVSRVIKK